MTRFWKETSSNTLVMGTSQ